MTEPLLSVHELDVRFGGLAALSGVGFHMRAGEILGIVGPNGAGKTTLFNALVGVQRPTAGSILFQGRGISGLKPHVIARLGMTKTFQNSALFPEMSVLENVCTAALLHHRLAAAKKKAYGILERLELFDIAGEDVANLTFPQKALTELARAMATDPKILLLDEVMAALSHEEMDGVIAVIRRLREDDGIGFIVIEHHMRAILSLCDRLLVLSFGQVIAEGDPGEVVRHPDVIKAYLGDSAGAGHA
ncbi:MAG: ABC transporter ATP-binding protein [Zoogloeaceae bacterium]|jgi:branched-chain amino acid transport system ATP-binding protein|nr:ABC transporter ATP-binding protein [Zoogloeaceae bacterium]